MYKWPNDIKQIVEEVLYASNPISCLEQYINLRKTMQLFCRH